MSRCVLNSIKNLSLSLSLSSDVTIFVHDKIYQIILNLAHGIFVSVSSAVSVILCCEQYTPEKKGSQTKHKHHVVNAVYMFYCAAKKKKRETKTLRQKPALSTDLDEATHRETGRNESNSNREDKIKKKYQAYSINCVASVLCLSSVEMVNAELPSLLHTKYKSRSTCATKSARRTHRIKEK